MVLWLFDTPHGSVRRYTLRQGAGSASLYETTVALGLPRAFRLSEAAGRKCRLDLARDGPYWQIERAMAL